MLNKIFKPCKKIDYIENGINTEVLLEENPRSLTVMAFDAHQNISEHKVETYACAFILEGEIEFTTEQDKYTLSQGEMLILPKEMPHSLIAKSKAKMLLIRL